MAVRTEGSVLCVGCGIYLPLERFADKDRQWLIDQYRLEHDEKEYDLLLQVPGLFRRHPQIEQAYCSTGDLKPGKGIEGYQQWMMWGRYRETLDVWIEEYAKTVPDPEPFTDQEKEALDYLRSTWFSYPGRITAQEKHIDYLRRRVSKRTVICPSCRSGRLRLDKWSEALIH